MTDADALGGAATVARKVAPREELARTPASADSADMGPTGQSSNGSMPVALATTSTSMENPNKRRSSSRLAGSYLSRAGSLSLESAFSVLDELTLAYDDDDGNDGGGGDRSRRSSRSRLPRQPQRSGGRGGSSTALPRAASDGPVSNGAGHVEGGVTAAPSAPTAPTETSNGDAFGRRELECEDTSGGMADGEGVQRKRARHEDKPRWHTQTYMLVQALRRHPQGECARTELIKSAIAIDAEIARERGLPRVFRGKTPINSASACLTMNKDKLFVAFKPPGARSTHFRLAFELGDFNMARVAAAFLPAQGNPPSLAPNYSISAVSG
ncbi:hypothetical protein THASP1DRAFT_25310 [Thamnocephalis sphaerospora]|uniref:Uncharacterized protein n=1 Tax=Thamnocephalis sphaerospora TaxID=78915 RepID=A0A4P9XKL6_9FUNG|nr:hypothetical protein THASP1DRAFT_25310 [Thamnocephalis sphaerospora]|eukprot:RKP06348.1 hypothetical protein THASP1DRAFT_25310 [Thamnocephalis sphaerospora]